MGGEKRVGKGRNIPRPGDGPERLLCYALYMMSCVCACSVVSMWCSCRPVEALQHTARDFQVSLVQEAEGANPIVPTTDRPNGLWEGGEPSVIAGDRRDRARTVSATACVPSLRTHWASATTQLGSGGVGCSPALRRRRAYTAFGTHRIDLRVGWPVRPCLKGKWRCAWTSWGSGLPS